MLVILTGQSGCGKTTVAVILERKLQHAVRLSSDAVRPEMVEEPRYSEGERLAIYRELLRRAHDLHEAGWNIILDATFNSAELRDRARAIAPSILVWMRCPPGVAQSRHHNKGLDPEIYEEPVDADLVLDTDRLSPEECALRILERLRT